MPRKPKPNGRKQSERVRDWPDCKRYARRGNARIEKAPGSHRKIFPLDGSCITTYNNGSKPYPPGTAALLTRLFREHGLIVLFVAGLLAGLMEVLK